jgi:hypothetical protein
MLTAEISALDVVNKLVAGLNTRSVSRLLATLNELASAGIIKIDFPLDNQARIFHHCEGLLGYYSKLHDERPSLLDDLNLRANANDWEVVQRDSDFAIRSINAKDDRVMRTAPTLAGIAGELNDLEAEYVVALMFNYFNFYQKYYSEV